MVPPPAPTPPPSSVRGSIFPLHATVVKRAGSTTRGSGALFWVRENLLRNARCGGRLIVCLFVFLRAGPSVESKDVSKVDAMLLDEVEADVYWCLTKLLDNIQVRACGQNDVVLLHHHVRKLDGHVLNDKMWACSARRGLWCVFDFCVWLVRRLILD